MGQIRYGARSLDQMRNREVEATSVKTWATTVVAVYETDPEVVAAVLPPPLTPIDEPLVRLAMPHAGGPPPPPPNRGAAGAADDRDRRRRSRLSDLRCRHRGSDVPARGRGR